MTAKAKSTIDKIYDQIGANDANQDVSDWLSTGFLPLNKALSGTFRGGFPVGRITEIFGGPSAGKTLLATMAIIQTQAKGGLGILLDYEHAFSVSRARKLGMSVDPDAWIYKQPETAEDGFTILDFVASLVSKEMPEKHVVAIVDSVASMVARAELETDYGKDSMKTRLSLSSCLSVNLKKLAKVVNKTNMTLIFLNQTRVNPMVMFGDKESTSGGNALKFYASVRIRLSKRGAVKDDADKVIGEKVNARVIKNKVFVPFEEAEYITHFKNGINLEISHVEDLISRGVIRQKGAWYYLGEGDAELKFMGKSALLDGLTKDADTYQRLVLDQYKD